MPKVIRPSLDDLGIALQALAEQMKSAHTAYAKFLPTTDPNVYYHTLDCNLHTMVGARFLHDEVQVLEELKDGTRVQYLSTQPELCFFVDIPKKKGKIGYLYLDCVLLQKEAASYRDLAELLQALDEKRAGSKPNKDADTAQRRLTSTAQEEKAALPIGRSCWEKRSDSRAHAAVVKGLEELGKQGTLAAAHEIYAIAVTPSRYTKRRNAAKAILERLAARLSVSVEDLIAQAVPREPAAEDRARVIAVQSRRLERMMVDGKRLPFARFRVELFEHPLLAPLCEKIVFASFSESGSIEQSFCLAGEKLRDARGEEVVIDAAAPVGVAHPVELQASGQLDAWRAVFRSKKIEPPFAQLERPLRALNARQASANVIFDFKFYRRDWLHEQEWWGYKVDADYMADADTFAVMMERDGKQIEAKLDGQGRIFAIGMGKVDLDYDSERKDYVATPSDATPFGKLHPVSQCELLYALFGNSAPRSS